MSSRDRSAGWKYAKLSGHENEVLTEDLLLNNECFQNDFLEKIGKKGFYMKSILHTKGSHEKNVDCILGGTTKSKTDIYILLNDNTKLRISVKKSLGGQVYLISEDRFIRGLESQYKISIPENVIKAISLFWGSSDNITSIVKDYSDSYKAYEIRKNRLVGDTLMKYNMRLYDILIKWFKNNINYVFDFCFSRGLAKNEDDWANIIWYINNLKENTINEAFYISEITKKISPQISYGDRNGGTTIQLPFGFVQWHQSQMQFHHNYEKIKEII